MVTAIILLHVENAHINDVAEALADMSQVSEVYSVGGTVDLVAMVRVAANEDLADLVTRHMVQLEGIIDTETMLAFRTYSRHDLERIFSIGAE
jgi:DNA-binding Lrp family transcriptional regulator